MKQSKKIAAGAAAAFIALAACGVPAALDTQEEPETPAVEQEAEGQDTQAEATQEGAEEGESEVTSEGRTAGGPEVLNRVETPYCSFELPEYWAGKVSWDYSEDERRLYIFPTGAEWYCWLATVTLVDGPGPEGMGDIAASCIYYTEGTDSHVEVWRQRWEVLANLDPQSLGDQEQFWPVLVDLSTMGTMSLEDAQAGAAMEDGLTGDRDSAIRGPIEASFELV